MASDDSKVKIAFVRSILRTIVRGNRLVQINADGMTYREWRDHHGITIAYLSNSNRSEWTRLETAWAYCAKP
jgi:hypothetical protein